MNNSKYSHKLRELRSSVVSDVLDSMGMEGVISGLSPLFDLPTDPIDWLYSHTTADTVDKVNVKGIKDAAAILALTLIRIADEDEIPVKHTPTERILSYLEENGIAEDLRVEKRWRRELSS